MISATASASHDARGRPTQATALIIARHLLEASGAIGLGAVITTVGLSDIAVRGQRPDVALRLIGARGDAAATRAVALQAEGKSTAAARLARQALGLSLVHVDAVRVLGQVEGGHGHPGAATALMRRAGRGGWRDAETQLWLVRDGLRTGDYAAMARRTDALLRLAVARPELFAMIRIAVGDADLRRAFVARFASRPAWRARFFQRAADTPPAQYAHMDSLIRDLAGTAAPVSRAELAPYLGRLVAVGEVGRAHRLWQRLAHAAPGWPPPAVLTDPLPFDWILASPLRTMVHVEGGQLVVDAAADASGTVASRRLYMGPGRYDLSFVVPGDTDPAVWRWRLRCPDGSGVRFPVARASARVRLRFARPACAAPRLELELRDTDRPADAQLRIGPVAITRVA